MIGSFVDLLWFVFSSKAIEISSLVFFASAIYSPFVKASRGGRTSLSSNIFSSILP
jgi:hypothetical protein